MANTTRRRIACFCEKTFEADLPTVIDVAARPEAADEVLRGEFMAVTCPACGKRLTPEFPCRFSGVPAGSLGALDIELVPEVERVAYLAGRLGRDLRKPDRVAIGVPELAEKLTIFRAGLDDRAVEILKYLLVTRPGRDAQPAPAAGREMIVIFRGIEGGKLLFHIAGLRENEVAVARLEQALYDRIVADLVNRLADEPFRDFCDPPYVSLRRVEQESAS
jgi:hypothetical protein